MRAKWVWIPALLVPGAAVPVIAWKVWDEIRRTVSEDPLVWERQIRAFERKDRKKAPRNRAIVFAGSSTIRLWEGLVRDMAPMPVIQRGFGGAKIKDVIYYADRIIVPYEPRIVVLYIGSNDMLDLLGNQPKSVEEMRGLYDTLLHMLHERLPNATIMALATFPSPANAKQRHRIAAVNDYVRNLAANEPWLVHIDGNDVLRQADGEPKRSLFRFDRVHLNKKGYARWGSIVRRHVLEAWESCRESRTTAPPPQAPPS